LLLAAALFAAGASARASDTDSEHLFGFTEGADIGKPGEREAETETIGRFGKSAGSYAAVTQNDQVKAVPFANFRIGANLALAYFDISRVPGLTDQQLATIAGASFETRFMLLDRRNVPFGLTLIAEPRWGRVDATSGEQLTNYAGTLTLAADRELIDNRLFGTFNVLYEPRATRLPAADLWQYDSQIGVSAALATRVGSALFLGGEVRYLRAYDGLGLNAFSGQAVFAGPTFYLPIAKGMALSGAWNVQLSGATTSGGALDLTHFERQQAKLRFNVNF
jgi:hypothetical protein